MAAIQSLITAACNREDSVLSTNAADVLARIGPQAINSIAVYRAISSQSNLNTNELDRVLENVGSNEEIQVLIELLKNSDWRIQRDAADFLGRIGAREGITPLTDLALDNAARAEVRAQCISSLGKFGDPKLADYLLPLLDSTFPPAVRGAAAESLGAVQARAAIDPLLKIFRTDNDPDVLKETALTLGELKARKALPELKSALFGKDADRQVQIACIEGIEKIDSSDGKKILDEGWEFFFAVDRELHRLCLNAWHRLNQRGV